YSVAPLKQSFQHQRPLITPLALCMDFQIISGHQSDLTSGKECLTDHACEYGDEQDYNAHSYNALLAPTSCLSRINSMLAPRTRSTVASSLPNLNRSPRRGTRLSRRST